MDRKDKSVTRSFLVAMGICCLAGVGIASVLKLNVSVCSNIPWAEVVYGPAIAATSITMLFFGITWIVNRVQC